MPPALNPFPPEPPKSQITRIVLQTEHFFRLNGDVSSKTFYPLSDEMTQMFNEPINYFLLNTRSLQSMQCNALLAHLNVWQEDHK